MVDPLLILGHKSHEEIGWVSLKMICFLKCPVFSAFEVLWPSQPNGDMSSADSLPKHTFTGQAQFSKMLISIVHIHSSEIDKLPFLNQQKREKKLP